MDQRDETRKRTEEPLRCPVCGRALPGERLKVEEDYGSVAVIYDFRCSNDDFRLAVTEPKLIQHISELVRERLNRG